MSCVTCHVSHVTCHLSTVTCHMSHVKKKLLHVLIYLYIYIYFFNVKKIGQSGGASRWRVCYQRGLPRLVYYRLQYQLYVCLNVGHTVGNITMTLQFPIIQNVLFHIVTHLDFCHSIRGVL